MNISNIYFSPATITLGFSSTLYVQLSQPAPMGGITVGLNCILDGSAETLTNGVPVSLFIPQGTQTGQLPFPTSIVENPAKSIIVSAFLIPGQPHSAQLTIT
jgi:hypothetical protein